MQQELVISYQLLVVSYAGALWSVTLPAGSGCPIRAATVRERTSRTRVMGVSALNRRFRYVERGPADSVTDPGRLGAEDGKRELVPNHLRADGRAGVPAP